MPKGSVWTDEGGKEGSFTSQGQLPADRCPHTDISLYGRVFHLDGSNVKTTSTWPDLPSQCEKC